jgi:hypothetical protein
MAIIRNTPHNPHIFLWWIVKSCSHAAYYKHLQSSISECLLYKCDSHHFNADLLVCWKLELPLHGFLPTSFIHWLFNLLTSQRIWNFCDTSHNSNLYSLVVKRATIWPNPVKANALLNRICHIQFNWPLTSLAWSDERCSSWRKNHMSWNDEHCSSCYTLSLIEQYLDKIVSKCNRASSCVFMKVLAFLWYGRQFLEIIS